MASTIPPYGLRMPPDLKEKLQQRADENSRSLNSELVYRLRRSIEQEKEEKQKGRTK